MKIIMNTTYNKRPRVKRHDTILQNWHTDEKQSSRQQKLTRGLAIESDFNDDFVTSFVSDEPDLLAFMLS